MKVIQEYVPVIESVTTDVFAAAQVQLDVLRLDQVHPVVSGNKWFKLSRYIHDAQQQRKKILTYGGAYSNHIVATAFACQRMNIPCAGIIRGEEPRNWSHTLQAAGAYGMQLHFVSREAYRGQPVPPPVREEPENWYIIPEGGYGIAGAAGFADLILKIDGASYSHFACAAGTGTMMSGLVNAATTQTVVGISVLRNHTGLESAVANLLDARGKEKAFRILHQFHGGGYARKTTELIAFMNQFHLETGIPTDFVYTGKLFHALCILAGEGFFPQGSRVLAVHSGGLQGNLSLPPGMLAF